SGGRGTRARACRAAAPRRDRPTPSARAGPSPCVPPRPARCPGRRRGPAWPAPSPPRRRALAPPVPDARSGPAAGRRRPPAAPPLRDGAQTDQACPRLWCPRTPWLCLRAHRHGGGPQGFTPPRGPCLVLLDPSEPSCPLLSTLSAPLSKPLVNVLGCDVGCI